METGKREKPVNKKQKKIKTAALILAILLTLLTFLSFSTLWYSYQEMRHEGLTYSQWYEGSIAGFYSCQFIMALIVSLAAAWIVFFRKPNRQLSPGKQRFLRIAFFGLIPVACALLVLTYVSRGELKAAQEACVEGLPLYIKTFGKYRMAALLACEALAAACFLQSKR